jgi:hypothetical protein
MRPGRQFQHSSVWESLSLTLSSLLPFLILEVNCILKVPPLPLEFEMLLSMLAKFRLK